MKKVGKDATYTTYVLILLNIVLFILEIRSGGSTNLNTLDYLGALVPAKIVSGEWWRLLNANFLHYGGIHLGTNMLALFFLGKLVELRLGVGRYLIIYLLSGMGAMLSVALLSLKTGNSNIVLVGASGAIMGLIGTLLALSLQVWLQKRNALTAQRLKTVIFVIVLQFILDNLIPQVSFESHLSGLIIGFFVSSFLLLFKLERNFY
ncbi:MAG: rhomboid family intramembrane serine protease [Xenococcaceae cyanobacterium MO_207.B15]|nr:rhomboid family intramembrane serine protease [Xenococcaceae cyanobacterium MO_207.B15]